MVAALPQFTDTQFNDGARKQNSNYCQRFLPDHGSTAEILGSNPTGGMDICLLWVSCVVFATSWSLVQRSPTDCGASLCVI